MTKELTLEQKAHWAYRQGHVEGLAGNTSERGWMAFGLSCAATPLDATNTRLWLAGFDAGVEEKKNTPPPPPKSWSRADMGFKDY